MAIAGVVTRSGDDALALAAPSPTYAFVLAESIERGAPNLSNHLLPAILCSAGYALFGIGLLAMAGAKAHQRLTHERERLTQLESMLDAELAAEEATRAPVAGETPPPAPGS